MLGIIIAGLVHFVICEEVLVYDTLQCLNPFPKFTATLFFNVLLPPIILDAAFSLYDREFLTNFTAVITFAILGTLLNTLLIGNPLNIPKTFAPKSCANLKR